MEKYIPPFTITNEILDYVSSIMEKLGSINRFDNLSKLPLLRKQNRIRSIQSSCSIEANSLSLEQVNDVINGKIVIGPKKDITEIKNSIKAYNNAFNKDPFSEKDFKKIHSYMTNGLVKNPGQYRNRGEGVIDENGKVIFVAPPGKMVNKLIFNLFDWTRKNFNKINALVLSSIFHYELVFIHPFSDGNGRMARLWQNLILSKWKPIFEFIPIESMIKNFQTEYYDAIAISNKNGNSSSFIQFMLKMIDLSLTKLVSEVNDDIKNLSLYTNRLVKVLRKNRWYTSKEIKTLLNLKDNVNFRKNYLIPSIKCGLVEMEYSDKPRTKNQRYKLK